MMDNTELMERFRQEVSSDPKIHCTSCGQTAVVITVRRDEVARMCMCFAYSWGEPPLERYVHELPEGWEWV